jgi:hypothetical protein
MRGYQAEGPGVTGENPSPELTAASTRETIAGGNDRRNERKSDETDRRIAGARDARPGALAPQRWRKLKSR